MHIGNVKVASVNTSGVTLTVGGVCLPYRMEKRVELRPDGLWMHYRAINRSPFDMPVLWSSHPLVDVKAGMRLDMPDSTVRIDSCSSRFSELTGVEAGQIVSWPQIGGQDLSAIPGPEAQISAKLMARHLNEGRVALVDPAERHITTSDLSLASAWRTALSWRFRLGDRAVAGQRRVKLVFAATPELMRNPCCARWTGKLPVQFSFMNLCSVRVVNFAADRLA